MIFKIAGAFVFALLLLQCAVFQSAFSKGVVTSVTKEDAGKTVQIAVGGMLQIELSGTPSTGYWWYFELLNEEYLELFEEETKKTSTETLLGAPIMGIWRLCAKRCGETTVKMAYYRPWEGSTKAIDHFSITVHIKNR